MNRPTFLEGAIFALLAAALGGGLHVVLAMTFVPSIAGRLLIAALSFGYLLYLLSRSRGKTGRITALAGWGVLAVLAGWLAPSLTLYALLHLAFVWLLRSSYFQSSVLAGLLDGGLCGAGMVAAFAAFIQTGSVALAIWCFFLVQALFIAIPAGWPGKTPPVSRADDRFEQAYRSAEAALRRLLSI
jgi:hypothetical protein